MRIEEQVQALVREYQTSDPEELARALGMRLYERSDFTSWQGCLHVWRDEAVFF